MKIFSFFFILVDCQNLLWSTNVTLNNYNWLPWDTEVGILIFFSNGLEYRCNTLGRKCEALTVTYRPNTYSLDTLDYFYYTDDKTGKTCRFVAPGTRCEQFSPTKISREFESIVSNGDILYYGIPDDLGTFTYFDWATGSLYRNKLKLTGNRYQVRDTLYSFKLNGSDTKVMKYSTDGLKITWTQNMPLCRPNNTDSELFVISWPPFVYAICSSSNVLYKLDSDKGTILDELSLDKGDIKYVQSSFEYIFILYGDASIVQYSRDFDYIHTYKIENTKILPKYNSFRADKSYLFGIFCSAKSAAQECLSPTIYQWEIAQYIPTPTIKYTPQTPTQLPAKVKLTLRKEYKAVSFSSYYLSNIIFPDNYDFTPITYKDSINQHHLIYFSGGGSILKRTCGDVFLHDIIVNDLVTPGIPKNKNSAFYQKYLVSNGPNYSRKDYAAILFTVNDTLFYIIHGGMSCDNTKTYSNIIAINLLTTTYETVSQEDPTA
jgi:hypothetical protein